MSAICGIIHFDGAPVDSQALRAMIAAAAHRGPDGVHDWMGADTGLAHLAFHVTPESVRETQPLVSTDGRLVLVADARIDNRPDLIRELLPERPRDTPAPTDADLLLHAYRRWGERSVAHLLGDFVFAVWNPVARELFLARDPLGAYSLSYHQQGSRFVFASETAAILDLPGFTPLINELAVTRVLAGVPLGAEESFFESIMQLPPGHCLAVNQRGIRRWRYWEPLSPARIEYRADEQYVDHFLEILDQAIACRVRSIGPVGISLSGGNDSTLLAARAAPLIPALIPGYPRLKGFSYVFDRHPECDERAYIAPVVAQYDLDATYLPSDDAWTFNRLDAQPIARDYLWTNCYAQLPLAVARAAQAAGCRLLLDGHFGDTLLSGHSYYAADLLGRRELRRLLALIGAEPSNGDRWRSLVDRGIRVLLPDWLRHGYRALRPQPLKPLVGGLSPLRLAHLRDSLRQQAENGCERIDRSRWPRCLSLLSPAWPSGMAAVRGFLYARHGLEKQSPYFDRRLVEFVLAIPQEQIARPGEPRRLQRAAMRRVLPPVVWQRTHKTRYEGLLRTGLLDKERGTLSALLSGSGICAEGWIDAAWLQRLLSNPRPDEEALYALSACAHFELWRRAVAASGTGDWATPYFFTP